MDVFENLAASKLGDDVKISVVLREAPSKLRDNLLVNSHQFESNYNKLRAIIRAYLSSNKLWIANEFRSDTKGSDPMEVDYISKDKDQKHMTKSAPCALTNPPRQNSKRGGRCKGGSRRSKIVYVHD